MDVSWLWLIIVTPPWGASRRCFLVATTLQASSGKQTKPRKGANSYAKTTSCDSTCHLKTTFNRVEMWLCSDQKSSWVTKKLWEPNTWRQTANCMMAYFHIFSTFKIPKGQRCEMHGSVKFWCCNRQSQTGFGFLVTILQRRSQKQPSET